MGSTDPAKALEGTIRKQFAQSTQTNSVHGPDSVDSAEREIALFFESCEIVV
jgi:nucleoside-diphosphate kinase